MAAHEIHTKIRGVTFDDPVSGMHRQAIIKSFVRPGTELELRPDPNNPVDPAAVGVWLVRKVMLVSSKEYHLGYLTHELASEMRFKMARGTRVKVTVSNVTGGKDKTVGVNILLSF